MNTTNEIICKYCKSENVVKYGKVGDVQYLWCKDCQRKFIDSDTLPKMKTPIKEIASAMNGYYGGEPIDAIQNRLKQDYGDYLSEMAIYKWVARFTREAVEKAKDFTPAVGNTWVADETGINVGGYNVWFWDIIDVDSRYLLASHVSEKRTVKDAQILIEKAIERAGKPPKVIITDKLRGYVDGINLASLGLAEHKQSMPFVKTDSTNMIERFHGILKQRTDAMHHFKDIDTARLITEGWLIHYNFFKEHESLGNVSPAQHMKTKLPFSDWEDIVRGFDYTKEQKSEPYNPEPKTVSVTKWDLSKEYNRITALKSKGKHTKPLKTKRRSSNLSLIVVTKKDKH
jgi:putative transposase